VAAMATLMAADSTRICTLARAEPKYLERKKIISGEATAPGDAPGDSPAGIPSFWRDVLMSFQLFSETANDADLPILDQLQDIKCEMLDPGPEEEEGDQTWGYRLTFVFAPNQYFEETELTKVYLFHDAEESNLKKTEGFKINWKPGACICLRMRCARLVQLSSPAVSRSH
jgi:Nucleosome assembly protein (NAP)